MEALAGGSHREEAIAAASVIPQLGTPIDSDLEKMLSATLAQGSSTANAARVSAPFSF